LENLSAWHNQPFATEENGFAGLDTQLVFNAPLQLRHIQQLADWQKDKTFVYGGREDKPNPKFASGECPMFMGSSGAAGGFTQAKVNFGISMLPYWPDVPAAPQNSIIGGATLWVMAGEPKDHYAGVAKFFTFISSPAVQADWHQATGYVPITLAAYELTKSQGFYEKNPGRDVAVLQLTNKPPTPNSKGLRLGNCVQIRDVEDEELEAVWAGQKTPKQALDEAVQRGNALLRQFQAANPQ
jgi:sn-glycerol 3-phosphate transport system substrate-binding protein